MPVETVDAAALDQPVPDRPAPDWPALAAAFRASDAAAAEVVATHLAPLVAQLVRRLTAWREDVDDLTQDVLVAVLAARQTFRGDAKLETWITRIAINRCRANARKEWLRKRLFAVWADRQPARSAPPADDAAAADEQAARVRAAVARLSTKNREAIVLCYLQNLTPAEAAEALGVSRGTLEVRLSRARDELRKLL